MQLSASNKRAKGAGIKPTKALQQPFEGRPLPAGYILKFAVYSEPRRFFSALIAVPLRREVLYGGFIRHYA